MSRFQPETLLWPRAQGLPQVPHPTRAVVVGGGIAGLAAATILVERGVQVTLLERETSLGGRAASFDETLPSGEVLQMERGFHAFFRQYYTLRSLLRRVDPELSMLLPLPDYPVLGPGGLEQSFRGLPKRTPLQVMALTMRTPHLRMADLAKVNGKAALQMLAYDERRTYDRFDDQTAESYLASLNMPERARRMLFDVFAHSFFNPERAMSAGELLMMFHFYFTGNPEGLLFDVSREPLGRALWEPLGRWLAARGADVRTGVAVERIRRPQPGSFVVEHGASHTTAELLVLALDVRGLQRVVGDSPDLGALAPAAEAMRETHPFAVLRLWLDRSVRPERVAFAGTTAVGLLDNISVYERFQGESAEYVRKHGGSVVELHAYAVPPELGEDAVRADLLAGLHVFYPETKQARIVHERMLVRSDCPAFLPGGYATRPTVGTPLPDVALAGDGLRVPVPCALMERAAITGMLAANTLLDPLGVASEPIRCVPRQGLFARPRGLRAPSIATLQP